MYLNEKQSGILQISQARPHLWLVGYNHCLRVCELSRMNPLIVLLAALLALQFISTASAQTGSAPVCPAYADDPYPPFANPGAAPNVAAWHDLAALPLNCHLHPESGALLTVAVAGQFTYSGPLDAIATRIGAISKTQNLPYWSVTDNGWRKLVSEAFALDTPNTKKSRADFTAAEVLSGDYRYLAQNDTRSWGLNIYRFKVVSWEEDHLVMQSDNVSPVKLGPITLLKPHAAQNVLFIEKRNATTWTYYSLAVIKDSALAPREKSLINRQAAFYRFMIDEPPDKNPPVAP